MISIHGISDLILRTAERSKAGDEGQEDAGRRGRAWLAADALGRLCLIALSKVTADLFKVSADLI